MVITSNSDYSVISIYSANLVSLVGIDAITLQGKINCEGTYSYTVDEGDISSGSFTVDLDTLFETDELADSIYGFTLIITYDDDTLKREYSCLFVDNDTKCDVVDCVAEHSNLDMQLDYYILSRAQSCDCDCTNLCLIYKRLKNEQLRCQSC